MVFHSTLKRKRKSNCVRHYIFCKMNISRWQPSFYDVFYRWNPLSFLLHKLQGYACGKHKNYSVTHNFFVDDLKLYANNTNTTKKQLNLVFSKDSGMTFRNDICSYQQIQNKKLLHCTNNLEVNQL